MGLTMGQRKAVTLIKARAYARGGVPGRRGFWMSWWSSRAGTGIMLGGRCGGLRAAAGAGPSARARVRAGGHRGARGVLGGAEGAGRQAVGADVAGPGAAAAARRGAGLTDEDAGLLMRMSAATIDRRLAPERAKLVLRGRSHTKPGSF